MNGRGIGAQPSCGLWQNMLCVATEELCYVLLCVIERIEPVFAINRVMSVEPGKEDSPAHSKQLLNSPFSRSSFHIFPTD